jgi:transglutaminase-like putative cysteine protease
MQGDCNEHTVLFTALARAVGLPTRMAAGVVLVDLHGEGPAFYYHAWPEVWLGAWHALDPTLGQFPADATHLRFVVGGLDQQVDILRLIGSLRVEIVDSSQALRPQQEDTP